MVSRHDQYTLYKCMKLSKYENIFKRKEKNKTTITTTKKAMEREIQGDIHC